MKLLASVVAITVTCAAPLSANTLTDYYTSFYSFGDSLTDDGKFGALAPPSFNGRFSNGQTWAEYIEDEFTESANLALGGATSGAVNLRNAGGQFATFDNQVEIFKTSIEENTPLPTNLFGGTADTPDPGTNPLVAVWFGANNIFQRLDPISAAQDVAKGIRNIAAIRGEHFEDFLVARTGLFSGLPAFLGNPAYGALLDADVVSFNRQLTSEIDDLRNEGLNIIDFDSAPVFDSILADIENGGPKFGILEARIPCTENLGAPLAGMTNSFLCANPDQFLFNDGVHPNAVAQRLIGQAAISAIETAAVPLPASLPLALFGLAGLGALGARRRLRG